MLSKMMSRCVQKGLRAGVNRRFGVSQWNKMIEDQMTKTPEINDSMSSNTEFNNFQLENIRDVTEIIELFPLGPRVLFNDCYDLTIETICYFSESLNMGWGWGVLLGSLFIRYNPDKSNN